MTTYDVIIIGGGHAGVEAAAASAHIPMANLISSGMIEAWLETEFKIRAVIDLGVGGTGFLSEHNRYVDKRNGKRLSHAEVLRRLRAVRLS